MKKYRKILSLFLVLSLILSLAGCMNDDQSQKDENVTYAGEMITNTDVLDFLGLQGKTGNADDYLFFSGIKPGMTPEEVEAVTKESGWHPDLVATYEEAYEYADDILTNSLGSFAQFTKEGNVIFSDVTFMDGAVISTRTNYEFYGKNLSVDEFKAEAKVLYDKFVAGGFPTDVKEQITDDVTKLENYYGRSSSQIESSGYDENVIRKGYNLDFREYHLWYSEGGGLGYACFMMHYANPEGDTVSQMMFANYVFK